MKRKIIVILISVIVTILIFYTIIQIGIDINFKNKKNEDGLQIVTTIFPYYDFARAVIGNDNNIHLLIKPGGEIHSYEPTPADIIKIQNSDIFIYNGGENEEWVDDILETIDTSKTTILKMMNYVEIYEEDESFIYSQNNKNNEEDEELEYDEHIWTSPKNAIKLVKVISEEIIKLEEANQEKYKLNTEKYIEEIQNIDNEIQQIVDNSENKLLIFGDRFPFRYFFEEFNLKYRAAFSGCSAETEPSASTVAKLIEIIKEKNIPVVLYIELSSQKVANAIAKETGTQTMCLQSCQSISKHDFENGKTYVSIMQENIETLKVAL